MSMNDDSSSRRGRRADQGEPDWRTSQRQHPGDRWDQPSSDNRDSGNRGRERQAQQPAWSGYRGPSYSQQPRQEPTLTPPPPAPQPPRAYEPPPAPQFQPQTPQFQPQAPQFQPQIPQYEPQQRQEPPRYVEPAAPYAPPPPAFDAPPPHLGYSDPGRDELFTREQAPLGYDQNPYGAQSGYRPDPYEASGRAPMMPPPASRREDVDYYRQAPAAPADYDRAPAPRYPAQESQAPRSYFEDTQPAPRPVPQAPQAPLGYAPSQNYAPAPQHAGFEHDQFDPRLSPQEPWEEHHGYHAGAPAGTALVPHGDELDEDFFADEDEYEQDDHHGPAKGGRMKLIGLLLVASIAVAGGGIYAFKSVFGGKGAGTAFISADPRPAKEAPGNPGGRRYPNGEKSIYERLTPNGQTVETAPAAAPPVQVASALATPSSGGSSLEDRIDEALRKARNTGDGPSASAPDQPTVVTSEHYRPDGTRADDRPVITPSISNVGTSGQLPYPFGSAAPQQPAAPAMAMPFRTQPMAAPPQQQFAPATTAAPPPRAARHQVAAAEPPAQAAAPGYYVSLKSAPDEKAVQRDIPALTNKYKSVLGDVQLMTKIADLGDKGVTYRVVAGPLGTQQEAHDLCQKIKGVGGDKACFVTK